MPIDWDNDQIDKYVVVTLWRFMILILLRPKKSTRCDVMYWLQMTKCWTKRKLELAENRKIRWVGYQIRLLPVSNTCVGLAASHENTKDKWHAIPDHHTSSLSRLPVHTQLGLLWQSSYVSSPFINNHIFVILRTKLF
jgi:hypothetical protein